LQCSLFSVEPIELLFFRSGKFFFENCEVELLDVDQVILEFELGKPIHFLTGVEMLLRVLVAVLLSQLSLLKQKGCVQAHYLYKCT
jgi:hypothetical protein